VRMKKNGSVAFSENPWYNKISARSSLLAAGKCGEKR